MAQLEKLFEKYDRLVVFDTETTGLQFSRDEIIEFAAVVVEQRAGKAQVLEEYDELVTLSPGGFVPPMIQELTGITNEDIRARGIPKTRLCCDIARMIAGNTLLLAYNAHFDLSFLYYLLLRDGDPTPTSCAAPSRPTAFPARWSIPTGRWTMCWLPWR